MLEHFYILIMAGGGGTRLWPLSRRARPKQTLPLVDEQSTFELTVRRLQPLVDPSRIFVVTGADQVEALHAGTPEIPAENFILEPFGRDSGPAAGLGTLAIAERDPQAIIATLSADHYIAYQERFRAVLQTAGELVREQRTIVTLGVSPSHPATKFGYIQRGEFLGSRGGFDCYRAESFTEKPNLAKAVEFLSSGLYSWNSGMFIWSAAHILAEYQRQQPAIYNLLGQIRPLLGQPDYLERVRPLWEQMPSISLDFAIMENTPDILVLPVDLGWTDVGSWDTLYELLQGDDRGNVLRGSEQGHIQIDTERTMIISNRMVVTIGVDDLVVVDTDDAVLICHRDRAQDVREVVRLLQDSGMVKYL